jgi:response regulator RpfG family c-di-GMP phosphodiesterase
MAAQDQTAGQPPAPVHALVVDDEPPLVRLVTSYLERDGFQVQAAGDGQQAVELARTFQPEVIVLDLMLPGVDGIEACRLIRTFSDAPTSRPARSSKPRPPGCAGWSTTWAPSPAPKNANPTCTRSAASPTS